MRGHGGFGLIGALVGVLGCGTSPAPTPTGQAQYDPAALFERLEGSYTLTFSADESCQLPSAMKKLTYDVTLEATPYRYLAVRVPGKDFVGDLWVFGTESEGFTLRWNIDCESQDSVGATSFRLCGEGAAPVTETAIEGIVQASFYRDVDDRPLCATGSHRFEFRRRS